MSQENSKVKGSLVVPVGSSVEDGVVMFWAFDPSCTRTYAVPENTRVDIITDTLLDFLGKDFSDDVIIKLVFGSRRAEKISDYLKNRLTAAKAKQEGDDAQQ